MSNKVSTIPLDDTVTLESKDHFTAWPILFGEQRRDRGGFWYNNQTVLQPPFEAFKVIFKFFTPHPQYPERSQSHDLVVAEVSRWRISPLGLWIRAKFLESPEADNENHPHTRILDGLKAEMRRGGIALTHSALRAMCVVKPDHYVSVYPIQLFNLYEKAIFDEIPPSIEAEK